ncbi:Hypothetical protein NocV09_00102400 [Nannochloropsis oceanica]
MSPRTLQPAKAWVRRRATVMAYGALMLVAMVLVIRHDGWVGKEQARSRRGSLGARALASQKKVRYERLRDHSAPRSTLRDASTASTFGVAADPSQLPPHEVFPAPCDCRHCDVLPPPPPVPPSSSVFPFHAFPPPTTRDGRIASSPTASSTASSTSNPTHPPSPPPWLGVGLPPRDLQDTHVRIIIRVHHLQEAATRSLIWAMRAQPEAAKFQAGAPKFTVDFALVATEAQGLPVVQRIAQDEWERTRSRGINIAPSPDVFVADTTGSFYALASNRSAPYRCSEADKAEYQNKGGENYVRLHCAYDNHAYYQATDVGVLDVLRGCPWCTHVLVTNSDNSYHPDFLLHTLSSDADLVTTDFVDHGERMVTADWRWGKVDLGGVLASRKVVMKTGGFIASLPPGAGPQETHDNDYWFVHRGLDLGATTAVVGKLLFFHN